MRTKYNKRRFKTIIMIIVLLLCMSIGYSYLLTTLNIEGTSNIKANTWDVHWENVSVKSGSVTGDQVPIAAHILTDTTQVEYSVILKSPGDYYEFTVDAKNAGTLDAMVSITDTKFYESNGVTQISLPNYLEYSFTYEDGAPVLQNQLLEANQKEKLKVKLKFKDNLEESELPTTDKTIVIRQSITYVQADETAIPLRNYNYVIGDGLTFSSATEAMRAYGNPFFIRNLIVDNQVESTDVGFYLNGKIYYLKGKAKETDLTNKPVYEENKAILLEAFGSENCVVDTSYLNDDLMTSCDIDGMRINASATTNGGVESYSETNMCQVDRYVSQCVPLGIG